MVEQEASTIRGTLTQVRNPLRAWPQPIPGDAVYPHVTLVWGVGGGAWVIDR